jgi:hypothetical protein
VDDAGCSKVEFCAQFNVQTSADRQSCRRADWRNDEPFAWYGDCRIERNVAIKGDRCVPTP